jgi:HEPN domain-containing protein
MTCFHAQQAAEKLFKALVAVHHQEIPRTHNLNRLHAVCEELLGAKLHLDEEGLSFLNDVYIDSRYPSDFGALPSGQSDKREAETALEWAKGLDGILRPMVMKWIREQKD